MSGQKPDPMVGTGIEVHMLVDCDEYEWWPATVTAVSWGSVTIGMEIDGHHYSRTRTSEWWNSPAVRIVPTKGSSHGIGDDDA